MRAACMHGKAHRRSCPGCPAGAERRVPGWGVAPGRANEREGGVMDGRRPGQRPWRACGMPACARSAAGRPADQIHGHGSGSGRALGSSEAAERRAAAAQSRRPSARHMMHLPGGGGRAMPSWLYLLVRAGKDGPTVSARLPLDIYTSHTSDFFFSKEPPPIRMLEIIYIL